MFCRSWRPNPTAGHNHAPGECRVCWKVCWSRPERGDRCEDCLWSLARHPSAAIRRQLVVEPDLPLDVLELLATDFDAAVQAHAIKVLDAFATGGPVLPADLLAEDRPRSPSAGFDFDDLDDGDEYDDDDEYDDELEPAGFGRWTAPVGGLPTGYDDRS